MRKKGLLIAIAVVLIGLVVWGIIYLRKSEFNIKQSVISQKIKTYNSNKCGVIIPNPYGYTNDFVDAFTPLQIAILDSIIGAHENATSNQITIITVDSTMQGKCNLKDYATEVGNQWGVGQKEKNNGCVFAIAPKQHQVFIANGYGIEKLISNEETKALIDSAILPNYKKANLFEGTKQGVLAIIKKISTNQTTK